MLLQIIDEKVHQHHQNHTYPYTVLHYSEGNVDEQNTFFGVAVVRANTAHAFQKRRTGLHCGVLETTHAIAATSLLFKDAYQTVAHLSL
jgi:hypothetical protein